MSSVPAPSSHIIDAVARSKDVETTGLPPLYETIDPDALDALCSSHTNGAGDDDAALYIRFTYAGRDVVVRPPEHIEVGDSDSGQSHTSTK